MPCKIPYPNPLSRCECCEPNWMTLDGTDIRPFQQADIKKVWFEYTSDGGWEGDVACIIELFDGRYVSWEATWGPTGNDFYCDAYGGGGTVLFSANLGNAVSLGLSKENKERYQHDSVAIDLMNRKYHE